MRHPRRTALVAGAVASAAVLVAGLATGGSGRQGAAVLAASPGHGGHDPAVSVRTTTPIKHLVVIFDENVSFDHYFGTYPDPANPAGEPAFHAAAGTPTVNGLDYALLHDNPNLSNPQRLDRSQALTCDQEHGYNPEQSAFDHGLMDKFVQFTGNQKQDPVAGCTGTPEEGRCGMGPRLPS